MLDTTTNYSADLETLKLSDRGMVESLIGQCRNANKLIWLDWQYLGESLVVRATLVDVAVNILLIAEDNIILRRDATGYATWRYLDREKLIENNLVQAVSVFYGECQSPGSIGSNSNGNRLKDNFRRVALVGDLRKHKTLPGCWKEIRTLLTERNLLSLFDGDTLRDTR